MKIVHVVEPLAAGMVTFLASLVKNLPDEQHFIIHGERRSVMPFAEVKKQFVYPNVKFFKWKSAQRSVKPLKDITALIELYTILKRLKNNGLLDVVHLHCSKGGFIGRLACRMLGIQDIVVYTPNGAPFMAGTNKFSNYLYKLLEKLASNFGGQVVCCSPSEQVAYQQAGINAVTINNGTEVGTGTIPPEKTKDKTFRIITTGRIADQKNPVLFNKIASYFEGLKQFEFVWAGDGTERPLLKAKNIKVTGWLNKDAVNNAVAAADMYLSTSNFEGLSFAGLEALALNKPVLLTDCTGNKDLVNKGLNGDVFGNESEAINKILQYYNNTGMLSIMGQNSGSYCQVSFNLASTYNSYKRLYQKVFYNIKGYKVGFNM